jgi:hypothetical protein
MKLTGLTENPLPLFVGVAGVGLLLLLILWIYEALAVQPCSPREAVRIINRYIFDWERYPQPGEPAGDGFGLLLPARRYTLCYVARGTPVSAGANCILEGTTYEVWLGSGHARDLMLDQRTPESKGPVCLTNLLTPAPTSTRTQSPQASVTLSPWSASNSPLSSLATATTQP